MPWHGTAGQSLCTDAFCIKGAISFGGVTSLLGFSAGASTKAVGIGGDAGAAGVGALASTGGGGAGGAGGTAGAGGANGGGGAGTAGFAAKDCGSSGSDFAGATAERACSSDLMTQET